MKLFNDADVEAAAKAIAIAQGWDGWDTAKDFGETLSGNDPEDERNGYREGATAALTAVTASLEKRGGMREGAVFVVEGSRWVVNEKPQITNTLSTPLFSVAIIRLEPQC